LLIWAYWFSFLDGEPIDTVTDETNPVTVTSSGEKNMATP